MFPQVEIQAGHSSSKMLSNNNLFPGSKSDHSLSGYSSKIWTNDCHSFNVITDRKAASRAKMGSRDTSTVSSRGLAGRISKSNLSHERGDNVEVNTDTILTFPPQVNIFRATRVSQTSQVIWKYYE